MSFDLSWLWETLTAIVTSMQSWFSNLWTEAQNIVNTGQGIFSGLIAFGSQLWDAVTKAFDTLGEWISEAFKYIWTGLEALGTTLGGWLSTAFQWLASGVQWVAVGLHNIGNWLWNGLMWIFDTVRNALIGLWNWITQTLGSMVETIGTWWGNVTSSINEWFTNLLKGFRQKIITTITADLAISGMWKAGERILKPSNLKDIGYGVLGLLLSPLVGYTIGTMIDSLIPSPSTPAFPLIPEITGLEYTPPSIDITRPEEPTSPTPPPSAPTYGYFPVQSRTLITLNPTYQSRWDAGSDFTGETIAIEYERVIKQEWLTSALTQVNVYGENLEGQTFTARTDFEMFLLDLLLRRVGSSMGYVTLEIYETDASGLPSGSPIVSVTKSAGLIPTAGSYVEFTFSPALTITEGKKYAIVLKYTYGDSSNYIEWYGSDYDAYPRGARVYSTDNGSSWAEDTGKDLSFDVYSY